MQTTTFGQQVCDRIQHSAIPYEYWDKMIQINAHRPTREVYNEYGIDLYEMILKRQEALNDFMNR